MSNDQSEGRRASCSSIMRCAANTYMLSYGKCFKLMHVFAMFRVVVWWCWPTRLAPRPLSRCDCAGAWLMGNEVTAHPDFGLYEQTVTSNVRQKIQCKTCVFCPACMHMFSNQLAAVCLNPFQECAQGSLHALWPTEGSHDPTSKRLSDKATGSPQSTTQPGGPGLQLGLACCNQLLTICEHFCGGSRERDIPEESEEDSS